MSITAKKTVRPAAKKAPKNSKVAARKAKKKTTVSRPREFRRGESPYSSPKPGQALGTESGGVRTVYEVKCLDGTRKIVSVSYTDFDGNSHTISRESWAQWCSRSKARLLVPIVANEPIEVPVVAEGELAVFSVPEPGPTAVVEHAPEPTPDAAAA